MPLPITPARCEDVEAAMHPSSDKFTGLPTFEDVVRVKRVHSRARVTNGPARGSYVPTGSGDFTR